MVQSPVFQDAVTEGRIYALDSVRRLREVHARYDGRFTESTNEGVVGVADMRQLSSLVPRSSGGRPVFAHPCHVPWRAPRRCALGGGVWASSVVLARVLLRQFRCRVGSCRDHPGPGPGRPSPTDTVYWVG